MNTPIERLLAALREHGYEPRRSGDGWICRCPAHDDRQPSLSIAEGDDGRVLVHCHAGCATTHVLAAIGLELRDLMPVPVTETSRRTRRTGVMGTGTPGTPPHNTPIYATAR